MTDWLQQTTFTISPLWFCQSVISLFCQFYCEPLLVLFPGFPGGEHTGQHLSVFIAEIMFNTFGSWQTGQHQSANNVLHVFFEKSDTSRFDRQYLLVLLFLHCSSLFSKTFNWFDVVLQLDVLNSKWSYFRIQFHFWLWQSVGKTLELHCTGPDFRWGAVWHKSSLDLSLYSSSCFWWPL